MHTIDINEYKYLNGIKGIAAIVIVIYHFVHFTQLGAIREEFVWFGYIGFLYKYGYYMVNLFL